MNITLLEKMSFSDLFKNAKQAIKQGNPDDARDFCDMGIARLANMRFYDNATMEDVVEEIKIETWFMRFWKFLENHNLMLDETTIDKNYYG
jgi:hypothetical protein